MPPRRGMMIGTISPIPADASLSGQTLETFYISDYRGHSVSG